MGSFILNGFTLVARYSIWTGTQECDFRSNRRDSNPALPNAAEFPSPHNHHCLHCKYTRKYILAMGESP